MCLNIADDSNETQRLQDEVNERNSQWHKGELKWTMISLKCLILKLSVFNISMTMDWTK